MKRSRRKGRKKFSKGIKRSKRANKSMNNYAVARGGIRL